MPRKGRPLTFLTIVRSSICVCWVIWREGGKEGDTERATGEGREGGDSEREGGQEGEGNGEEERGRERAEREREREIGR